MEISVVEPKAPLQDPEKKWTGPLRILVQTTTSLVPGNDYDERVEFMRNLICQHHWNRDFDWHQDRWNVYGHESGYANRNCYFLIDHGHVEPPEDPSVLWYKWTGESLIAIQETLPAEVQSKLRKYPFSRRPVRRLPGKKLAQLDAAMHRRVIRSKLRCDMTIIPEDIRFLLTHPEDARWLKDNLEPRFWAKLHLEQNEESLEWCALCWAESVTTYTHCCLLPLLVVVVSSSVGGVIMLSVAAIDAVAVSFSWPLPSEVKYEVTACDNTERNLVRWY
ncbi:uncharacterized protein SPSK_07842 [Sporothrix schenckii 1099-18]|uniref:Uncharacterized protein n=1 Tax=Sporothrix schenckii 1099-18 TaxID=1397361 RepID=A0A0F2MGE1_SPOSC|nr:uncharacterized protein SPSK_07842 [Sporothrix schenckii 1099-18]KJR88129.1 hypothetical protein SPSK_07842 [Sporothrix schenckii 1099-18]